MVVVRAREMHGQTTDKEHSMSKNRRAARWNRRKAQKDGNHAKHGTVGGNVRYSGKGGTGGWPDTRAHRTRRAR